MFTGFPIPIPSKCDENSSTDSGAGKNCCAALSFDYLANTISSPSNTMTTPSNNMSTPSYNMSTPSNNMSTPSNNMSTPSNNMSPPSYNMSTPSNNMSTLSNNMSTPSNNMSTPCNNMSTPSNNMSTPSNTTITPSNTTITPSVTTSPASHMPTRPHHQGSAKSMSTDSLAELSNSHGNVNLRCLRSLLSLYLDNVPLECIKGLHNHRIHSLRFLTIRRAGVTSLSDIATRCGADNSTATCNWQQLLEADFSYNPLGNIHPAIKQFNNLQVRKIIWMPMLLY